MYDVCLLIKPNFLHSQSNVCVEIRFVCRFEVRSNRLQIVTASGTKYLLDLICGFAVLPRA